MSRPRYQQYRNGFTLTEILVTLGLAGIVGVILSAVTLSLKKTENSFGQKGDYIAFVSDLTAKLHEHCGEPTKGLVGKTVPMPTSNNQELDLDLPNYWNPSNPSSLTPHLGTASGLMSLLSGTPSNPRLRLKKLTWKTKNDVAEDFVTGTNASKTTSKRYNIRISILAEEADGSGGFRGLAPNYIDLMVYTDSSNKIESCSKDLSQTDICAMMGAQLNNGNLPNIPATNSCVAKGQCQIRGAFATSSCNNGYPAAACPGKRSNPATGLYSCPTGTVTTQTGQFASSFQISCGKKCTQWITATVLLYLCMACTP